MKNLQETALDIKANKYSKTQCLEKWPEFKIHSMVDDGEEYELSDDTYVLFVWFDNNGTYLSMQYSTYK